MKKRLKINGVIMFLAFLLVAIFPEIFLRRACGAMRLWDRFAGVLGVSSILLGQLFRLSARGFKAENSKNGNALIESGPYSLVRNPMYLGIFLIGSGVVLMLFEWWVLAVFIIIFIIRYIPLVYSEEKKLTALFPESYSAYCKKVPQRIWPSLWAMLKQEMSVYLPVKMAWVKKEIGSILAVLLSALLIKSWEVAQGRGIILYFGETAGIFIIIGLSICLLIYLNWRTTKPKRDERSNR